ncbi:PKD domain-containing protein [Pseudarthrobacter sp. O4]|uniref:PKD domain-containing protein n=1 Tax=Pseudarthrobacter sp. O4 TaxID=3418417 RepID=UPI003CF05312
MTNTHESTPVEGTGNHRTRRPRSRFSALSAIVGIISCAAALTILPPAGADTMPVNAADPATPETVSADALPTAQIDGVVWQQVIVGNTVYAAGNFKTARPAGSAAGINTVARSNIVAYNLDTGAIVPGFAPTLNAEARSITASPDGSRIYVGGSFTSVNGTAVYNIAALNPTTGALITSFRPLMGARVNSIVATNETVYAGGWFTSVGSVARTRLAALKASNGALLPWNPTADIGAVNAMVLSPDGSKMVVGGAFTSLNGSANPGYGLGAVDTVAGASLPWASNSLIRNGGTKAAILSLKSDGTNVYGSGYVFGTGGNLEGAFSANWNDGSVKWVEDCHGDSYDVYPSSTAVYVASHSHACEGVNAFPQTDPWTMHHGTAYSKAATQTLSATPYSAYYNFKGKPGPSQLNWYPDFTIGTFTGQGQATWAVTGNGKYVVMGGEFTAVNGQPQQGLVRFATKDIAPNKRGPMAGGKTFQASAASFQPGTVRVSWPANWDQDNRNLSYELVRDNKIATPIYKTSVESTFWNRPLLNFVDSGLNAGSSHSYRVYARDPFGNVIQSLTANVTVATAATASPYADAVLADGAANFWRLGEAGGTTAMDTAGSTTATVGTGVTRGIDGAINADPNTASTFDGSVNGIAVSGNKAAGPSVFSAETWVRTTSTVGGKILGYGNAATGNSTSYDRHVYIDAAGKAWFGVNSGGAKTVNSTQSINDGQWHHIMASLSGAGMRLFVDGKLVAQRTDVTSGQAYSGYWRIGGDNLGGWPSAPSNAYLSGDIDEVAIYPTALTRGQVQSHYQKSGRTLNLQPAPADAYGKAVFEADPQLYWRLGETSGTQAGDSGLMGNQGTLYPGATLGAAGAISGTADSAAGFDGVGGLLTSNNLANNPTVYSAELWFNTTTSTGGKLIGFGNQKSGLSSSYDRHVYMETSGKLTFGVYTGSKITVTSPGSYNDGKWHHLVASQSSSGMALYVDGGLAGANPETRQQAYDGYWRVGGDRTWGPQPYFAGLIDEVAVYPTALTAAAVATHYSLGAGTAVNAAPVSSFAAAASDLMVAFDGSGSSDADGTVASYAWDFGDGTAAGTGQKVSHTYGQAGTYTARLTVTDNAGATHESSQSVTVVAAAVNAAPVSSFAAAASDLVVAFDGSGSSDADGTVASYAWDFGDGTAAGTGQQVSHTYGQPGTFTVRLTVTDNAGATHESSQSVTVSQAPVTVLPLAKDGFERSVTGGLGAAEAGGNWTLSGSGSFYSVGSGSAVISTPAGKGPAAHLGSVASAAADSAVTFAIDKLPSSGAIYVSVIGRRVGTSEYRAKSWITTSGALQLQVTRVVGGVETAISTGTVPGPYVVGDSLRLRLAVSGAAPTTVQAKMWKIGSAEPAGWQATGTDSTAGLQVAGSVGMLTYLSGIAANGPVSVRFDDWLTEEIK